MKNKIWDKTYLKRKVSKLKIPVINASIIALLVTGPLLFKKTTEKDYKETLTFSLIKSDRPLVEFYDVTPNKYPKSKPYISMIENSIEEHKDIFNLDPIVVSILMNAESGYDPDAVSVAGAVGLMQLIPETAKEMGLKIYETDIYDKLKKARKNMKKTLNSAIKAGIQEDSERSNELFKQYNLCAKKAYLLFQEYKRTLLENKDLEERFDPEKNTWAGIKYFAILARLNMGDRNIASLRSIIAAYNYRGEEAAEEWVLPTIRQPINHANIVIEPYRILRPLAMQSPIAYVK
jgi:hypothetical protein